jgi:uncharacterized protein
MLQGYNLQTGKSLDAFERIDLDGVERQTKMSTKAANKVTGKNLAAFSKQKYLNLETFRKSGLGVPTPVWFVEEEGVLYVRTGAQSGKVKRARSNSRVRVAACDARGSLRSDWFEADAHLVDEAAAEKVNNLLKRKYGLTKFLLELFGRTSKMESATLAIYLC